MQKQSGSGLPRSVVAVAVSLGVLLALGVAALGLLHGPGGSHQQEAARESSTPDPRAGNGPLALPPVDAPEADSSACAEVLEELPAELDVRGTGVARRELARPAPPGTLAWGDADHAPITLRCGITAPAELTRTSELMNVSGVDWLPISSGETTSWIAVDRPVYVALTASEEIGSGPVQEISETLRGTLAKQEVFP
ncbi:DUF3515 domain-containing protein [Actinopolyspora mortivallis]|uniref:DUF3515 domain-containing protein n=1 Tax=Actinopolyspora mortivallis TaxID=33906 RepID=UPI001FE04679|nr:DUF3515 domain-containing protein [Actinopolyspora mortivallis]